MKKFLVVGAVLLAMLLEGCEAPADKDYAELKKLSDSGAPDGQVALMATGLIGKYPNDARAYYLRGMSVDWANELMRQQALTDFSTAVKLDPKLANGYYGIGLIYTDLERYDLAESSLNKAVELAPSDERKAVFINGLAAMAYAKKEYPKAADAWRQAIKLVPDGRYFERLGSALYDDGKKSDARDVWQASLTEAKFLAGSEKAWNLAVLAHYYSNDEVDLAKAKDYIGQAVSLAPDNRQIMDLYDKISSQK